MARIRTTACPRRHMHHALALAGPAPRRRLHIPTSISVNVDWSNPAMPRHAHAGVIDCGSHHSQSLKGYSQALCKGDRNLISPKAPTALLLACLEVALGHLCLSRHGALSSSAQFPLFFRAGREYRTLSLGIGAKSIRIATNVQWVYKRRAVESPSPLAPISIRDGTGSAF
jgi:hypothetical protein